MQEVLRVKFKYHLGDVILHLLKRIPCDIIFHLSGMKSLMQIMYNKARSSHPEMFHKKGDLKNFAKFTEFFLKNHSGGCYDKANQNLLKIGKLKAFIENGNNHKLRKNK